MLSAWCLLIHIARGFARKSHVLDILHIYNAYLHLLLEKVLISMHSFSTWYFAVPSQRKLCAPYLHRVVWCVWCKWIISSWIISWPHKIQEYGLARILWDVRYILMLSGPPIVAPYLPQFQSNPPRDYPHHERSNIAASSLPWVHRCTLVILVPSLPSLHFVEAYLYIAALIWVWHGGENNCFLFRLKYILW